MTLSKQIRRATQCLHIGVRGQDPEEGSTTVEYAIGAVAAAGFAGLLLAVLKSGAMRSALQDIIERALSL